MSALTVRDIGLPTHRVETSASGCWIWTAGTTANGYGTFRSGGVQQYAHRVAYRAANGSIPDGYQIDHLCRVRACVNPAHLEAVTSRVNTMRGVGIAAQNARKTHCPSGHEYTRENTYVTSAGRYCRSCRSIKNEAARARRKAVEA